MTYRILSRQLYSIADTARQFCKNQWGISDGRMQIEEPIVNDINFVTTLHAVTSDFHWLCIEVAENAYPATLDAFVLECKNRILPVKLYVAMPENSSGAFKADLARARKNGVGILEVTGERTTILQEALPLSLTGLRALDPKDFPMKYRQAIADAVATFHSGNPAKGCSVLYDELEDLTRRIASKALKGGFWKSLPAGQTSPKLNAEKDPWAKVVKTLWTHFDPGKANCPNLTEPLLARAFGITAHRNETAHKPKSQAQLMRRDSELRTRFEGIGDLLRDLIAAAKPLRV